MTEADYPPIVLKPGCDKRLRLGYPWVYSNEIQLDTAVKTLDPGTLVRLRAAGGAELGVAVFNRHTLIAARLMSGDPRARIDRAFLAARLERARQLREGLFDQPYYRLIHAEADGLPGLIVDRFGDSFVLQVNGAGMETLTPLLIEALEQVFAPPCILLRNDSPVREIEGLPRAVSLVKGRIEGPVELRENGARYLADLEGGQKTGWFFDQRDNRAWAARLVQGGRVLDCYSHSGGFGILAALSGASEVVMVDRSESALALAREAADLNGVAERCQFSRGDVFAQMERRHKQGETYDLVIADPPAFVKSKKDLQRGVKGYRKLARLAADLVAPKGFLVLASCSHHVGEDQLLEQAGRGLHSAGRAVRVLHRAGAAADHPLHPALPESAYLKALFFALD